MADRIDFFERGERLAKILSLILIPVLLAVGGWVLNSRLKRQDVNQQYVQLSLDILRGEEGEIDPSLRTWAAELLSASAPLAMEPELVKRLGDGQAALPHQRGVAEALVGASKEYVEALDLGVLRTLSHVIPRELSRLRHSPTRAGFAGPGALQQWLDESSRRATIYRRLVRDAELLRRFFLSLRAATPRIGAATLSEDEVSALLKDLRDSGKTLSAEIKSVTAPSIKDSGILETLPRASRMMGREILFHLDLHVAALEDLENSIRNAEQGFIGPTKPDLRAELLNEARRAAKGLKSFNNMRNVLGELDLPADWNERAEKYLLEVYKGDATAAPFRAMGDMVGLMRLLLTSFLEGHSSPAIATALSESAEEVRQLTAK